MMKEVGSERVVFHYEKERVKVYIPENDYRIYEHWKPEYRRPVTSKTEELPMRYFKTYEAAEAYLKVCEAQAKEAFEKFCASDYCKREYGDECTLEFKYEPKVYCNHFDFDIEVGQELTYNKLGKEFKYYETRRADCEGHWKSGPIYVPYKEGERLKGDPGLSVYLKTITFED